MHSAPVGQRSQSETLAAILKAFVDQLTWKQADLARHVGVLPATIKKHLEVLRASGVLRPHDVVVVGASRYTPTDLVRMFQHLVDVADDADAAEAEWRHFRHRRRAMRTRAKSLYLALSCFVSRRFQGNYAALADFGLAPRSLSASDGQDEEG